MAHTLEFLTKCWEALWPASAARVWAQGAGSGIPQMQERSAGNSKAPATLITWPMTVQEIIDFFIVMNSAQSNINGLAVG